MMEMDVTDHGKSMEVLFKGVNDAKKPCKKHSKVDSSKAYKTRLVMELNTQWHSKNICMSVPKSTTQNAKREVPK